MHKAGLYGFLGDKDKAFQILDKLLAEKDDDLIGFQYPRFEDLSELRSDPRFDKLLKEIKATFNNKN
jgi:hypothetical protein